MQQVHPQAYTEQGLLDNRQQTQNVMQSPIVQQQQPQYQQIPSNYQPQIGLPVGSIPVQNPIYTPIIQNQINLTDLAMQYINIPDQLNFEHMFEKLDPCCSGPWAERSIFSIPGIGTLTLRDEYQRSCRCKWKRIPEIQRRRPLGPEDGGFLNLNLHNFDVPDYLLDNGLLEMEFWSKCGIVTVAGIPILKFQGSQLSSQDIGFAHWCSGYPKVAFHFLLDQQKNPLKIYPEVSLCPETICSVCPELAIFNICKSERKFFVQGLMEGQSCTITNTRRCSDAFARAFFLQGCCGCPDVDYPQFSVSFQNVLPIEKLAILLALVHYNIIKKWYRLGAMNRQCA